MISFIQIKYYIIKNYNILKLSKSITFISMKFLYNLQVAINFFLFYFLKFENILNN